MSKEQEERDAIVAWLREPVWHNMGIFKRAHMAIWCILNPADVISAVLRNISNSIERGDHRKANP